MSALISGVFSDHVLVATGTYFTDVCDRAQKLFPLPAIPAVIAAGGRGRPKDNSLSVDVSDKLLPQPASPPVLGGAKLTTADLPVCPQTNVTDLVKSLASTPEPNAIVAAPVAPAPKRDSRAETARQNKIPERKIRAAAEIEKKDPEAITRIARGETTIIQERAKLNAAARAAVAERTPTLPTGRYSCIVIDPPWQMEKIEREVRASATSTNCRPSLWRVAASWSTASTGGRRIRRKTRHRSRRSTWAICCRSRS